MNNRMTYDETMAWGSAQYADVLGALRRAGHGSAQFTQTGGMCAALIIPLEAGHYVLVTDEDDTLSWDRGDHQGWWVGLHADQEMRPDSDGAIREAQTRDSSIPALLGLVDQVMSPNW